jgi:hypothetical protein
MIPVMNNVNPNSYECINNTNPKTVNNAEKETTRGHGLASTI